MKTICIIGAGQIGSRHLQGLKKVSQPLRIFVVDPFEQSLHIARERYDAIQGKEDHHVEYLHSMNDLPESIDVAIIATGANVRRKVIENVLRQTTVRFFILEKLLFQSLEDYVAVETLLKKHKAKAWVDCSMRTIPFYAQLKKDFDQSTFQFFVTGGNFGLITTIIHYIDLIAYLGNCYEYTMDTTSLEKDLLSSKRKGFFEMKGTIRFFFTNGIFATITSYSDSTLPLQIEIVSSKARCICWEEENKALIVAEKDQWKRQRMKPNIPYQSEMTTYVIEDLLQKGDCALTPFHLSAQLHIILLTGLLTFLNKDNTQKVVCVPFT
jgi:predicted dehydrogenase